MNFQKIPTGSKVNLKKTDFEDILKNYNLGKYELHTLIWNKQNSVYKISTSKGKYILKVFGNDSNFKFIEFQHKISEFLKSTIPVPVNILTKSNKFYIKYKNKILITQKYIPGIHPKKLNKDIISECAYYLGKLDKKLLKINIKEYDSWGEHIFKKSKFYHISEFNIKDDYNEILIELKKINLKKFKLGYIHADLHESNILVKDNKISAIIDFDDCHKDYLIYELAVFISFCLFNKNGFKKTLLKKVLIEYEKSIKLSKEEKSALYYLIKQRLLSLILWAKKHRLDKDEWVHRMVINYVNFCKISFKEFKDLLK